MTTRLPRVLFVDDEPAICRALLQLLTKYGFSVRVEGTSQATLVAATEEQFDAVVLDFWLRAEQPEDMITGATLYRELVRRDPGLADRTIFVTGDPSEPTQKRLTSLDVTYLLKPFEIGLLVSALREKLHTLGLRDGTASAQTPDVSSTRSA